MIYTRLGNLFRTVLTLITDFYIERQIYFCAQKVQFFVLNYFRNIWLSRAHFSLRFS